MFHSQTDSFLLNEDVAANIYHQMCDTKRDLVHVSLSWLSGIHQGPAEVVRSADGKRDAPLHPADPGGGLVPAQQHDRPQRHQR